MIAELLLWALAAYGSASLLAMLMLQFVIWLDRIQDRLAVQSDQAFIHYQLLLLDSEHVLEHEVRRLNRAAAFRGEPVRISFKDYGSTDDTMKMTHIFERNLPFMSEEILAASQIVTIDLRRRERAQESS